MRVTEIMTGRGRMEDVSLDDVMASIDVGDGDDAADTTDWEQAEIDAAIAELQAELAKLDKRTHEISITFRELKEQRRQLAESVLGMRRRLERGTRKAPVRAMRDISRAFQKRLRARQAAITGQSVKQPRAKKAIPARKSPQVPIKQKPMLMRQAPAKQNAQAQRYPVVQAAPANIKPLPIVQQTPPAVQQQAHHQHQQADVVPIQQHQSPQPSAITKPIAPTPPSKPLPAIKVTKDGDVQLNADSEKDGKR